MKLVSKIIVLLIVWVMSISAQGSVTIDQIVRNLPIVNVNGSHWAIYDLADAEFRVCYESDIASVTTAYAIGLFWSADIEYNFPSPLPAVGDSLLVIGSWDSAYVNDPDNYGSNSNHTGFYWLYSDTLDDPQAIHWRDDTLRPLPYPLATQVGGPTGDIEISITNPAETRYTGQSVYDVLGFWIWADTTGAGTPDAFNDAVKVMEVGFASVNGGPGGTTIYSHPVSNYHNNQTVYWAYKLVARPDTTASENPGSPGYATHYFSHNSNPIVIIGIEENTNLKPGYGKLEISPNPFTNRTDITCSMGQSAKSTELKIFDVSGRLIRDFPIDLCNHNKSVKSVRWYGTDVSGEMLPSGVYFVQAKSGDLNLTKKVILQRK